jgi:hypothetical protein
MKYGNVIMYGMNDHPNRQVQTLTTSSPFLQGTGYEYDGNIFVAWVLQVRRAEVVTK